MTGKFSRVGLVSVLLTVLLASVNVRMAYGRVSSSESAQGEPLKATVAPHVVTATPTPAFAPEVIELTASNPEAVQITEDGCCPYPDWSSDSEWVLFVDSEGKEGPGLYGVPAAGGPATFLTARVGSYSEDLSLVAYPEAGLVYVERWAIGDRWLVPSEGREVFLSHENEWIAWEYGSTSIQDQDLKQRTIWIATIRGEDARELVTVHGGRFLDWIDHGKAILVSGRLSPLSPSGIWRVDRDSGAATLLFSTDRARDVLISAEGEWLVLTVAFQSDRSKNGIWVLRTDGSFTTRLPVYGSYRWKQEGQLLIIPYDFEAQGPYLWQIDIKADQIWALTDPEKTELPIGNNDWQPSPDGNKVVFYSHNDDSLWVLDLPKPLE